MLASDPVARLGLAVAVVLAVAKLGGDVASRLKLPSVLGELIAGVALGSLPWPFFAALRSDPYLDMLARIGVLVLLFEVGLESTLRDVLRVGIASARVAVLGIAGTLGAGWIVARLLMHEGGTLRQVFIAAAVTATSIGISARVLKDAGASQSREAHTILSAAVLDDVLGLVVLAILSGAVATSSAGAAVTPLAVTWLVLKTVGLLAVSLLAGVKLAPALFGLTARLRTHGALVATGLSFCFVLAWVSDVIGLAPIVGAFTAGLILEESHSARFVERGERCLAERMEPISSWLVPIFFVLMGMRADLRALAHPPTLLLTGGLAAAAIAGKMACALGVPRGADRLAVALGMVPRGEVSLVFAHVGAAAQIGGAPLLDQERYSAIVAVVVVTTLFTPVALRWRLERLDSSGKRQAQDDRRAAGKAVGAARHLDISSMRDRDVSDKH
jgi:Kef-type K+ transport system membrane component KefB